MQCFHTNYITYFFESVHPSELQTNKQMKTQNHPAKTTRDTKDQDLWQQGKLNCKTATNSYVKEDKTTFRDTKHQCISKQLYPVVMEEIFKIYVFKKFTTKINSTLS